MLIETFNNVPTVSVFIASWEHLQILIIKLLEEFSGRIFYRCVISSKCFKETAICIHFTTFGH